MSRVPQIHWHEGLFLQPHHLQTMQRQMLEQGWSARRLMMSYPYGVIAGRLAPDALENMVVRFEHLRVVMPSGLEISFPDNADLAPLNIEEYFGDRSEPFMIYLAVPNWYPSRANALEPNTRDDGRSKRLYKLAEVKQSDENTGQNAQPVLVRRINARLLLDRDDRTDMEVMPIVRVVPSVSEQSVPVPRADPNYIPPSVVLSASPALMEKTRELYNHLEARRRELLVIINRGGFNVDTMRGEQFAQMLRLRIYNHASGRLAQLIQAPATTPFDIYLELRGVLGELAALHPDRVGLADVAPYNHDNPMLPFEELCTKVRNLLVGPKPPIDKVDFVRDGRRWVARLEEKHLTAPNEYFLAIRTKQDPATLAKLVEDGNRFKLMPRAEIDALVYGIKLSWERYPPLQLPSQVGVNYFRLNRAESGRMWDRVRSQRELAARWPELESTDYVPTLYMTLPSETDGKS